MVTERNTEGGMFFMASVVSASVVGEVAIVLAQKPEGLQVYPITTSVGPVILSILNLIGECRDRRTEASNLQRRVDGEVFSELRARQGVDLLK